MESRKTVFDYFSQVFTIFGVTLLLLNVFCVLFGEDAREYSTMFALGAEGLTVSTMLQFLLVSVLITALRIVFFTDGIIRRMPLAVRTIGMFAAVFVTIVAFIVLFDWFPVNLWQAWVGFLVSFGVSVAVSTLLTMWKEKMENRKLEEALLRAKQEGEFSDRK